jgi:hypothetical protein
MSVAIWGEAHIPFGSISLYFVVQASLWSPSFAVYFYKLSFFVAGTSTILFACVYELLILLSCLLKCYYNSALLSYSAILPVCNHAFPAGFSFVNLFCSY